MNISTLTFLLFCSVAGSSAWEGQDSKLRRRLAQSEPCIVVKQYKMLDGGPPVRKWQCELQGNDVAQAGKFFVDFDGLDDEELDNQNIASGRTTLKVDGAIILPNGKLQIPGGAKKEFGKAPPRGPAAANQNNNKPDNTGNNNNNNASKPDKPPPNNAAQNPNVPSNGNQQNPGNSGTVKTVPANSSNNGPPKNRALQTVSGTRKVLAVRIKANDSTTTLGLSAISTEIFGTGGGDLVNLSERFKSCSYDQVIMQPFQGNAQKGPPIVDGVIEVTITANAKGADDNTIQQAAVDAATAIYGDLPSQFDHVVLCLPPGTAGSWIAYAWVNHWLSVYNDDWCTYPSATAHEIGHNLNLDHGWENNQEYTDQTGFMGYSYSEDEGPRMCYNAAKSWQLGWYPLRRTTLDLSATGLFSGSLIGVADYQHANAGDKKVIIKIENGAIDYYVGFNRQAGINSGVMEYGDRVTIHQQGDGASRSDLLATLVAGGEKTFQNYKGTSESFTIKVNAINLSASPPSADISIFRGTCASSSTCNPACGVCCSNSDCAGDAGIPACAIGVCGSGGTCSYDTSNCPGLFQFTLVTDNYPAETSWKLVNECDPNKAVVLSGGPFASTDKLKTFTAEKVLGKNKHTLTVYDSYGDGVCCSYGAGSVTLKMDGVVIATGGAFQSSDVYTIGSSCASTTAAPTPPPSPAPTPPPSPAPTPQPTLPPTPLPTPPPTGPRTTPSPTPLPTRPPTPSPTPAPTPAPTPSPTPAPTPPPTTSQNMKSFELQIVTDNYPQETTWQLLDACSGSTTPIASGGPYTSKGSTVLVQKSIPSSRYTLTMKDSAGDGLCCGYGNGSYSAKLDGTQVVSGGSFGSTESSTFGSCANQVNLDVKFTLVTDNYPSETSWKIMDTCSNSIVLSGGSYNSAGTIYNQNTQLPANKKYTLTVSDSYGDGICCGHGNGSYKLEVNGIVVKSGGTFTSSESVSFGATAC